MSGVYFVTGKLGGGKTLSAVGKVRDCLVKRLTVATNLDLNLSAMFSRKSKNVRVIRLPDKPILEDMEVIGCGNETIGTSKYDPEKNGLIVLDECGTWFNSRTWNDKARQGLINWFLHARKKGWDIIFIVQDISIVDKQARLALAEHVVYCRRLDRVNVPFIGFIFSLMGVRIPMPRFHLGIVKYGDQQNSLVVDRWFYRGGDLYKTYDTLQKFSEYYPHKAHSLLPPYNLHHRNFTDWKWINIMRLTKILARKYNRGLCFMLGCLVMVAACFPLLFPGGVESGHVVKDIKPLPVYQIVSYQSLPGCQPVYSLRDGEELTDSLTLARLGWSVVGKGPDRLMVAGQGVSYDFSR